MYHKFIFIIFSVTLVFQVAQGQIFAAGWSSEESSSSASSSDYSKGEKEVNSKSYKAAIKHLQKAVKKDNNNADAYNLLGYSNRKLGNTDKAFLFYNRSLEIDPDHLGANEYLGELYLETDQLQKAEERLTVLGNACSFKCEEYEDLKEAIEKYKSGVKP